MSINITEDLNIDLVIISTESKTINDIYDSGSLPGTYIPGKDFAPDDNVSTGVVVSYKIGISLTSKTHQTYSIDKLFLQSLDDPKTNGSGLIPLYYINSDPNPENITDDGNYTILNNYATHMSSVVFDQNAGVTSASTVSLTLHINYPDGIYWKTKIAPKIVATAQKDTQFKSSNTIFPLEVKMSSTALITNDFYRNLDEWSGIRLSTNNGVKGFYVPFYMTTSKTTLNNINDLLDFPNTDILTYSGNLNFTIDGSPIDITKPNISLTLQSSSGVNIESYDITSNIYTVVLKKVTDISFPIVIRSSIFLPYDPGNKQSVTMNMVAAWDKGVVFNNWVNEYIFSKRTIGGINASQIIPLVFSNPPVLANDIISYIQPPNTSISSNLYFSNLDFLSVAGSKLMILYDSKVSYISDAAPLLDVAYYNFGSYHARHYRPPTTDYIQQYGYVDLDYAYDANALCQDVFNGVTTLGTYQDIVNLGHTPNILITTILTNVLANLPIDYSRLVTIGYQQAQTSIISNTDFTNLYQNNPSTDFTSYIYTSMNVGTNISSVAIANAKYKAYIASIDKFINIDGKVYLNLGTVTKGSSGSVIRFQTLSTVRTNIAVPKFSTTFKTAITDKNLKTITNITDYTQTYMLNFFVQSPSFSISQPGTFKSGSILNFAIPSNILPYIYISNNPVIYKLDTNYDFPILIDTINTYSIDSSGIHVTMLHDTTMYNNVATAIYLSIPVKFLLPAQNQLFTQQNTTFNLNNLVLAYPDQLVTGFNANTPYYKSIIKYENSTLQGAGVDFTGLSVDKNFYQNGDEVRYIASVKNQSSINDSIYMALSTPTNEYNPLETSNNTQAAYITDIMSLYPSSVIYYQTASKVTQNDIQAMKVINPVGTNLSIYYNTVIVNNWTPYHNFDVLPSDVVYLVSYTPNVVIGDIVRVDFNVKVNTNTRALTTTFVNDSAFNYFSSAANISSQSNKVSIQNFELVNNIVINKSPSTQSIEGVLGKTASFTITFDVPVIASAYSSLSFIDQLPMSLTLLPSSTLQIGNNAPIPLNATISQTKLVTLLFTNMLAIAGQTLTIVLNTSIDNVKNISLTKTDTNQAHLMINSDPTLISDSNIVNINFYYTDVFNIKKLPLNQSHPKTVGEKIEFDIYFDVPEDISNISNMTITDILPNSLSYDPTNSFLQIGTSFVEPLNAVLTGNIVTVNFTKFSTAISQTVKITLATILTDIIALPPSNVIQNNAKLTLNNTPAYFFVSNTVNATFGNEILPIPITKSPTLQTVTKAIGEKVNFNLEFVVLANISGYNDITISDILDESLKYNPFASTIQIGSATPTPLNANIVGNTLTIDIKNISNIANEKVNIYLSTIVNNINKIPQNNQISNHATLTINNDVTLQTTSNNALVNFKVIEEKNPIKTTSTSSFNIQQDKTINFDIKFFSQLVGNQNMTINISDIIDKNLEVLSYSLDIVNTPNISIVDNTTQNNINYLITTDYLNTPMLNFPVEFNLHISAKYIANTISDNSYIINNFATIQFDTALKLNSNVVIIKAVGLICQAVNDVISSVALQQTALSHILNAEGEKLQKLISISTSTQSLIKANQSVESMINSITLLENVLQSKLQIIAKCKN